MLEVTLNPFGHSHDTVQGFDNVKYIVVSEERFTIPHGALFAVDAFVAAAMHNADGRDFRDGFAALHLIDLESRLVLDIVSTGRRIGILYERRPADAPDSFLYIMDVPVHCPSPEPGIENRLTIAVDTLTGSAHFLVDGKMVCQIGQLAVVPRSVQIALGILTVHPLAKGSRSLRGQGLTARWSSVRVARIDDQYEACVPLLEP